MKTKVFANILIPSQRFLECCEHDLRKGIKILAKTSVFIFHHSIQHDEASGYNFYEVDCPN